jgi:ribosome maturation factor RimP
MPVAQDSGVLDRLTELCEQAASGTGIEVLEVQLRGSGKARLLRVYIDKSGGVTHGDCGLISERFGKLLDEEDVLPDDSYTLEVSSPGAERRLSTVRDFERVLGRKVRLALREIVDGAKSYEGKLAGVDNDTLEIETLPGQLVRIPLAKVQKANLKFEW